MSPPRRAGFSLIEVLCAVVILAVGLVGILEGVTLSIRMSKAEEERTTAAWLAAERLDETRTILYLSSGEESGDFGEDFPLYAWRQRVDETALEGLFDVTVSIEKGESEEPIFQLTTQIFETPFDSERDREKEQEEEERAGRSGRGGRG